MSAPEPRYHVAVARKHELHGWRFACGRVAWLWHATALHENDGWPADCRGCVRAIAKRGEAFARQLAGVS